MLQQLVAANTAFDDRNEATDLLRSLGGKVN